MTATATIETFQPGQSATASRRADPFARLMEQLRSSASQATRIASRLEHGSARTPLTRHFQSIAAHQLDRRITAVLVGLDTDSLVSSLQWLTGLPGTSLVSALVRSTGVLQIVFRDRGFAIGQKSARTEFFDLRSFLTGLSPNRSRSQEFAPSYLEVANGSSRSGLRLLVLKSPWQLQENPELLAACLRMSDLFIAAALNVDTLQSAVQQSLGSVIRAFPFAAGIVGNSDDDGRTGETLSRTTTCSELNLGVVTLLDSATTPLPPWFQSQHDLVQTMAATRAIKDFEASFRLLDEYVEQKQRYQSQKCSLYAGEAEDSGCQADCQRDVNSVVRQLMDESLAGTESHLNQRFQSRTLPAGYSMNRIANLLEDLSPRDISEEPVYKATRLRVSQEFLQTAISTVRQMVHQDVRADLEVANQGLQELCHGLGSQLCDLRAPSSPLIAELIKESETLEAIDELIHIDSRYHGELPRRNWMDRISSGRRPVFVVMMIASMVGSAIGMRGGLMTWLLPAMLVLFVLGTVWTFRSFQEERQAKLDREITRVRDTLGNELKRLYEIILKRWLAQASAHIRQCRKELGRQVEDALRADQAERDWIDRKAAERAKEKQRAIQHRLQELSTIKRETHALLTSVAEMRRNPIEFK